MFEKGVQVLADNIPIKEVTKAVCKEAGIEPLLLISSGSHDYFAFDGAGLAEKLEEAGIEAAVIGRITESGKTILEQGTRAGTAKKRRFFG